MHKYLLKKDQADARDFRFSSVAPKTVLHDTDYTAKFPAVWDQGQLGSCQSHAIDAIDMYIKGYAFTPSHLFEYYNVRALEDTVDQDAGGNLRDTCAALAKNGVCDAAIWPYDIAQYAAKPPQAAYDNANLDNDKIYTYYRVSDIDQIRQALSAGYTPLIGIRVYENFEAQTTLQTGIIPAPRGTLLGGHALVIVGHHDEPSTGCKALDFLSHVIIKKSKGSVKIRNSWGAGIGLNGSGYFQADYEVLEKLLMDMWVIIS
ncbi:MAG: C1 family peptidase [Ethanoligenens sp.]